MCVWFKWWNSTKLLAWCSRLIPPFLLRNCDWSHSGGLMVCCNLRAFFSDSQEWSGWGSCRHNCCANLELIISESKVKPIRYPNILLLKKKKKPQLHVSLLLGKNKQKEREKETTTEWKKKRPEVCLIFSQLSLSVRKKEKKKETAERLNHKRYREESILGDRSKQETKRRKQLSLNT